MGVNYYSVQIPAGRVDSPTIDSTGIDREVLGLFAPPEARSALDSTYFHFDRSDSRTYRERREGRNTEIIFRPNSEEDVPHIRQTFEEWFRRFGTRASDNKSIIIKPVSHLTYSFIARALDSTAIDMFAAEVNAGLAKQPADEEFHYHARPVSIGTEAALLGAALGPSENVHSARLAVEQIARSYLDSGMRLTKNHIYTGAPSFFEGKRCLDLIVADTKATLPFTLKLSS